MSTTQEKDADVRAQLQVALRENSRFQDQLYFLTEMGSLLGQLELSLLLVKILELTTEFIGADVGAIVLVDAQNELTTAVNWGIPHEAILDLKREDGARLIDLAIASGTPQVFQDAQLRPVLDGSFHVGRAVLQPLKAEGRVLGSIVLVLPDVEDEARTLQLEALAPAAGLAAIAIENARLVRLKLARELQQQQLKTAQQIQRGLLPTEALDVPGLELATAFIPATEVGGDYYDYQRLADGSIGLVIADVAGKGIAAGLVMTAVRAMFRTAWTTLSQPGPMLRQVNEQLCRERLNGFFVTALCVRVDVARGVLTLARAGHDPLLLLRDGRVETGGKKLQQPPLGLVETVAFQEESYDLGPGGAFVLYTDGVTEAMNEFKHQFGTRHLQDIVSKGAGVAAQELVRTILAAVDAHVGQAPRHDDVTLLVGRLAPR